MAPLAVGGFGSSHITGCNFAFADGSVRFIDDSIEQSVLQRLANRADGHIVDGKEMSRPTVHQGGPASSTGNVRRAWVLRLRQPLQPDRLDRRI